MTRPPPEEDNDFGDPDDDMDEDEELIGECQLMRDGQCMLAGSEHCDFECSMRESEFFAGSAAWNRKHKNP